jgi:hypothetical protein
MASQCDAPSSCLMFQHRLVQELQRQLWVMAGGSLCRTHGSRRGCLVRLQPDKMVCSLERDTTSMSVGESVSETSCRTSSSSGWRWGGPVWHMSSKIGPRRRCPREPMHVLRFSPSPGLRRFSQSTTMGRPRHPSPETSSQPYEDYAQTKLSWLCPWQAIKSIV